MMTRSISIIISLKHKGMISTFPKLACEQFICCDRWERTEGREKISPALPFALFFLGSFRSGAGYFFALVFYSYDLVPAFQEQIDVF